MTQITIGIFYCGEAMGLLMRDPSYLGGPMPLQSYLLYKVKFQFFS